MKKWTIGLGSLLAAGALTAGMALNVGAAQISEARAKEIALKNAGVKEGDVSYINVKTDWEDGRQVYDVEFYTKDYREFDYEIEMDGGAVVSCDYDAETSFWKNLSEKDRTVSVTEAKAKEIALKNAGLEEDEVTFVKSELDYDDGVAFYEVEFYGENGAEYDYEISAWTGEIVSRDYDAENYWKKEWAEKKNRPSTSEADVTAEEAKAAALKKAGLKESQVDYMEAHLDRDDGRLVYEGKFFSGELEYEFEVDASTGKVTDWDVESIYD